MRYSAFLVFTFLYSIAFGQEYPDSLLKRSQELRASEHYSDLAKNEYQLGKYYYNAYEDSLSVIHFKKSARAAEKISDKRTEALATNFIGSVVSDTGNHEDAIKYYKKAIQLAGENDTLKASFLNNYGLELKAIGDYRSAVSVLYESLELKEKIGASEKSISSGLLNIGLVWDILEDADKAIDYYKKSLHIKRRLKDSLGISRVLSNIAVIAKNRGELEKAVALIYESNSFNQGQGDYMQYYINHTNLGNIFKKKGEDDLFVAHFDSAYFFAKELNNSELLSDIHQNLGTYFYEQRQFDLAVEHLEKAVKLPGDDISIVLLYELHGHLSEAHAALGNHNKAYAHLIESNYFRDSIYSIENQKAIQEVRELYETEKKEKELALKDAALQSTKAEGRRKTIIILSLIASFLILGLLGFIMFRSYKERQRRKIASIEQKLAKSREEIEVLRTGIQAQLNESPNKLNLKITQEDINQYLIDPLTDRELDVLKHIAEGKTNKEIGEAIFVSQNTVKYHLKNVYLKLDVKNRTEAITKADALQVWNRTS